MKHILLFLLVLSGPLFAQNQEKKANFSGRITDAQDRPLANVPVLVQETNVTTTTDTAGRFTIRAAMNDVLVVKQTGYLTQTVPINTDEEIGVTLTPTLTDAGEDDDVIIPFGVRKKRQVNSAITTFSASRLPLVPISSANSLLAGRIAGLNVTQTGSAPGADGAFFQIRGRSTFGPSGVRVLIDGIPRDMNDLDLNEIESVTVLKDAAALAWYGLRAGNGVVLVTTKKGSATRSKIQFDVQGGVQVVDNLIKPLNSYDFASLYNEALVNDGSQPIYTAAALDGYKNNSNPYRFPDNNYPDYFLNKSSASQRYTLSADGGSSTARYFVLLSYFNQEGIYKHSDNQDFNSNLSFDRFNFRGNVDFDVNKNLTVGLNVGGRSENRQQPGGNESGTLLNLLYTTPPNAFPIVNENGSYGGSSQFQNNPLGLLRDRGYTTVNNRVLMATFDIRQKFDYITKGLSANVNYSYDAQGDYFQGLNRDYEVVDATGTSSLLYRNKTPLSYRGAGFGLTNRRNEAWAGLDYDRVFGNHSVRASVRGQRYISVFASQLDFKGQGLSSRVDYSFKDRYYVGFVGTYSGSENFAPTRRYGFFPALSAGWIVSDEAFLPQNQVLTYLKLRASYGQTGSNDVGGARFPFENFFARNTGGGGYAFGTGFSATTNANEVSIANPNITWETLTTINAGVDLKLFRNALSLSVDLFNTRRTGILTQSAIPSVLGQTVTVNEGEVTSRGIDLALTYQKQIGKLDVSVYANATATRDILVYENGQGGLPDYQQTLGKLVGSRFVFLADGIFQTQAEIAASPKQVLSGKVVPGDIRYRDIGGIDGKPDGLIDNYDRVRLDERDQPKAYFGFGTALRYGLFDLSVNLQGTTGRTLDVQGIVNAGPNAFNSESLNRWTPATAATATYPRLGIADRANNTSASDFWLVSGDYLRVKNAEVGITLPPALLNRYRVKNARLYVGGFNLLTVSNTGLNIDPEIPFAGQGNSTYPFVKTYYAGLRLSF